MVDLPFRTGRLGEVPLGGGGGTGREGTGTHRLAVHLGGLVDISDISGDRWEVRKETSFTMG